MQETISCAMIVRNSAGSLRRVLESVRPHVHELVIVDTGSEDATCEIAAEYADVLVGRKWEDSFALARQAAFSLCTKDWILWLDSDDELIDGHMVCDAIDRCTPDQNIILLRYITSRDNQGRPTMEFWRERLIRREAAYWVGRAHEVLVPTGVANYIRYHDAYVEHHGGGDPLASLHRNIRLLRMQVEETPDDARMLFYLGRDLISVGERDEGQDLLERYVTLGEWQDEVFIAQQLIGYCYRARGEYNEAFKSDLLLQGIHPEWPMAYFALAEDAYYLKQWAWVHHYCRVACQLPVPDTNLFINRQALESDWMIHEVIALYNLGKTADAAALTEVAIGLRPDDELHQQNLKFFRDTLPGLAQQASNALVGAGC